MSVKKKEKVIMNKEDIQKKSLIISVYKSKLVMDGK